MSKPLPKNLSQGFTLIEILIAVAIITVVAAIGVASFNSSGRANTVSQQAAELKSLARKLRVDARAASKQATGACDNDATFYGAFLTLNKNTSQYYSGIACFLNASGAYYNSEPAPTPLKESLTFNYAISPQNLTIFYHFDGRVRFYNTGAGIRPDKAELDSPTSGLNATSATVAIGSSSTSIIYNLIFSDTGLVCDQRSTAAVACSN